MGMGWDGAPPLLIIPQLRLKEPRPRRPPALPAASPSRRPWDGAPDPVLQHSPRAAAPHGGAPRTAGSTPIAGGEPDTLSPAESRPGVMLRGVFQPAVWGYPQYCKQYKAPECRERT